MADLGGKDELAMSTDNVLGRQGQLLDGLAVVAEGSQISTWLPALVSGRGTTAGFRYI